MLLAALAGAVGFIVGDRTTSSQTTTLTVTTTRTETTTVQTSDLPDEVGATRDEILRAAEARDWDGLQAIVDRSGDEFRYTFGANVPGGPIAYWKRLESEGQRPLETLAAILKLPYTLSSAIYVWPFAYDKTADELTQYEQTLLNRLPDRPTVGPEGYLGWRAGIRPDGRWVFYVAGD